MLCKCHWIVLYIVHFASFCLGGPFFAFFPDTVYLLFFNFFQAILSFLKAACENVISVE